MTSKDLLNKVIEEMGEDGEAITSMDELPKFNLE